MVTLRLIISSRFQRILRSILRDDLVVRPNIDDSIQKFQEIRSTFSLVYKNFVNVFIACSFLHSWITRMLLAHSSTICIINCILRKLSDFFLSAIISITSSICRCTIRKMQLLLLGKLMCRIAKHEYSEHIYFCNVNQRDVIVLSSRKKWNQNKVSKNN
ncbi:hypothetical protein RhiirA5_129366 [Rhizophagus irregularis]|uniref:Uncharacterized protein n=1 Tax=Rhizophagus irregularis TaxID=588596 RepID=A0A2N0PW02_9GLOM|nr:hypothetical protein RhiirA5_129366 [Rhizophagus irregularis]